MDDVQNRRDERGIPIDQVGVAELRYPVVIRDAGRDPQTTIATFSMSVSLPQSVKGTHMSRFVEVLSAHQGDVSLQTMPAILDYLRRYLDAEDARIEVSFPYFLERAAPASGARALMDYECSLTGVIRDGGTDVVLGVRVPVTSLCPCSKAISDYGAHNQRGWITVQVQGDSSESDLGISDLVELAEGCASSPVYPLLKRADERHVTMAAYDHPVFVEDMVRNVAERLKGDPRVAWFEVHAVNHESIHNHNAFARLRWQKP